MGIKKRNKLSRKTLWDKIRLNDEENEKTIYEKEKNGRVSKKTEEKKEIMKWKRIKGKESKKK